MVVYTLGHSTRPLPDFLELLHLRGVTTVADVRSQPGSRHCPQYDQDSLQQTLPAAGIRYAHLPLLGGRRHTTKRSVNLGWRNASFRGYADYLATPEFRRGLEQLRRLGRAGTVALMCAEAVPWRCHRSLIADALLVRGVPVFHIQSRRTARPHQLTPFARVRRYDLTYPVRDQP